MNRTPTNDDWAVDIDSEPPQKRRKIEGDLIDHLRDASDDESLNDVEFIIGSRDFCLITITKPPTIFIHFSHRLLNIDRHHYSMKSWIT